MSQNEYRPIQETKHLNQKKWSTHNPRGETEQRHNHHNLLSKKPTKLLPKGKPKEEVIHQMANPKADALKTDIKIVFHVNPKMLAHINQSSIYFDSRSAYIRDLVRKDMGLKPEGGS